MGVLSKPAILQHYKAGNIIIDPFEEANVNSSSYDVRLGENIYRQSTLPHTQTLNPFYENSINVMYPKIEKAIPVEKISSKTNPFYNLGAKNLLFLIAPGETILAHTIEFIGGRNGTKDLPAVTTEMRARSSLGRIGIAVCKCAGWGDVGFINRWTMEITNFSSVIIPLPVGLRVAQIIFHSVEPIDEKDLYSKSGKYQTKVDLKKLKESWKPESMLPKLYLDREKTRKN